MLLWLAEQAGGVNYELTGVTAAAGTGFGAVLIKIIDYWRARGGASSPPPASSPLPAAVPGLAPACLGHERQLITLETTVEQQLPLLTRSVQDMRREVRDDLKGLHQRLDRLYKPELP
jgi:hypothetical protein